MKLKLFIIACILSIYAIATAQHQLLMTNGKSKAVLSYKIDSQGFTSYRNMRGKQKIIDNYYLFAIKDKDGKEHIVYKQDGSDAFTIPEMRSFVMGQSDANSNFKSPLTTIGGIVSGAAAPFVHPTYAIVLSGAYTGGIGMSKAFKKNIKIPDEYANNKHYIMGYKKEVKRKRIKNAVIGSLIGLAAGFTAYYIVKKS